MSLKAGDRVRALWQGGSTYYSGEITKVNADGSFAITYDDGDKEDKVPLSLVEAPKPKGTGVFAVGTVVSARYQGGSYFPGKVAAINADGTYDIQFDDGDFEAKVPAGEVSLQEETAASSGGSHKVWVNNAHVGDIEQGDTVIFWKNNSKIGEIEEGDEPFCWKVWVNNSHIGDWARGDSGDENEPSVIWLNGRHVGDVDGNFLWVNNSKDWEFEGDYAWYKNSKTIEVGGMASNSTLRRLVMTWCIFFHDA